MNTSLLEQELAPLTAQIEQARSRREALKGQLHVVETKLDTVSSARQKIDALREVCNALDKLGELQAEELFWKGIPGSDDAAGHIVRVKERIAQFDGKISGVLEKQSALQEQIQRHDAELDFLLEEVRDVHEREQRRQEEFVIEREISAVPYRTMVMPWTKESESESRFRRSVLVALLVCFVFGTLIPLITVPIPDRSMAVVEIPKRLAKLVKEEPPKPAPPPKPVQKQPEEEPEKPPEELAKAKPDQKKPDKPAKSKKPAKEPTKVASKKGGGAKAARKKAERVGVLAFKDSFADLMDETPVAKIGTEAHISKQSPRAAGQAVAQRSLVAMQATGGSSGGIGNAGVSRNIGSGNADRLGGGGAGIGKGGNGTGFARVESNIADLEESSRPVSDGPSLGRTDEEIQIVFDRYKATLYRIYNRELRKDPTLRGKILLRISIATDGAVSLCKVESTDLDSPELVAQIVARIKRFNFGPKDGVPQMTILYPIDFLPAG